VCVSVCVRESVFVCVLECGSNVNVHNCTWKRTGAVAGMMECVWGGSSEHILV
jgi:hypothetical protein